MSKSITETTVEIVDPDKSKAAISDHDNNHKMGGKELHEALSLENDARRSGAAMAMLYMAYGHSGGKLTPDNLDDNLRKALADIRGAGPDDKSMHKGLKQVASTFMEVEDIPPADAAKILSYMTPNPAPFTGDKGQSSPIKS